MYKETRPMLCEDGYSDEEIRINQKSKNYHYLGRHSVSREKLLGAARIISAWPSHLSSTFSLFTIAMAVLFIVVFVLYSTVAALPSQSIKSHQFLTSNENLKKPSIPVYMHIITNNGKDVQLNQYIFNIHRFVNDFPELQYNLIVLYNDTVDANIAIDQTDNRYNNEVNIITKNDNVISSKINSDNILNIQYITLSRYLDNSPLSKYWRKLPNYFIPFMVRALSIWDKGGIAFDPDILSTDFPAVKYINKLAEIIERYGKFKENISENQKVPSTKRFNNIRDIIDEMENNIDNNLDMIPDNIIEESNVYNTVMPSHFMARKYLNKENIELDKNMDTIAKYPVIINPNVTNSPTITKIEKSDLLTPEVIDKKLEESKTKKYLGEKFFIKNNVGEPNLSLDLNGLIIATDTPCHAFLGTLFSNSYHYYEEHSITDFIIRELTIFCNGLLSSCKGIDLIFV